MRCFDQLFQVLLLLPWLLGVLPSASGADYAFLVGVHQYDRAEMNPLQFPESDVTKLASTLDTNGFDQENIVLLTPARGVKSVRYLPLAKNIRNELKLLLAELTPQDSILVGFSGHGVQFANSADNYFCPLDVKLDDRSTLISLTDVYGQLEQCRAGRKLLLVDACRDDPQSTLSKSSGKRIELEPVRDRKPPVLQGGTLALFSCSTGQQSFEDPKLDNGKGAGLFFHFVTVGLQGAADLDRDQQIDFPELKQYAVKQVQRWARVELARQQTPEQLGRERGLFLVVRLPQPELRTLVTNTVGMKLRLIPSGSFQRGSPDSDTEARGNEKPQRMIRISKPFYLGVTEVTQRQWREVMGADNQPWAGLEFVKEGDEYPAVNISWEDAADYCRRLSMKEQQDYRLPTEAEWEYACRSGTTTLFSFGDDFSQFGKYAWFKGNTSDAGEQYAHPVGLKQPNAWGLYDMHGNVCEWCSDWYDDNHYYQEAPSVDPQGPTRGEKRMLRGGCWLDGLPLFCRTAFRLVSAPDSRGQSIGLRLARAIDSSEP